MPSKRRPRARRASQPRAERNRSTPINIPQARRRGKPRPIPIVELSERSYAARDRSLHVLAAMRRDPELTPTRAGELEGVGSRTLKKYLGSKLKKVGNRYYVTHSD